MHLEYLYILLALISIFGLAVVVGKCMALSDQKWAELEEEERRRR